MMDSFLFGLLVWTAACVLVLAFFHGAAR